jgi:hypothetical protein
VNLGAGVLLDGVFVDADDDFLAVLGVLLLTSSSA